jgi:hypothetical protein
MTGRSLRKAERYCPWCLTVEDTVYLRVRPCLRFNASILLSPPHVHVCVAWLTCIDWDLYKRLYYLCRAAVATGIHHKHPNQRLFQMQYFANSDV